VNTGPMLTRSPWNAAGPKPGAAEVVRELLNHLAGLHNALQQLVALSDEKLAALRTADTHALRQCAFREEELLKQVLRQDDERAAILARVAQHLPGCSAHPTRLTELLACLPEPLASPLRARSEGLREIASELARKNRLVARVAQNLQAHIRGIFADVAKAVQESVVYRADGQHEVRSTRCCVDAVG